MEEANEKALGIEPKTRSKRAAHPNWCAFILKFIIRTYCPNFISKDKIPQKQFGILSDIRQEFGDAFFDIAWYDFDYL